MKKMIIFSCVILTTVLLAGCTRRPETQPQSPGSSEEASPAPVVESESKTTSTQPANLDTLEKELNSLQLDEVNLD